MIQDELRETGLVTFEGATLVFAGEWESLSVGDLYVTERNDGPKLLTVLHVDKGTGWVIPVEVAYCFDLAECVKVTIEM